ncbi:suppressor of fused domain protein [Aquimarina algiphila]|uniref:suppressor of fused domain protein n=1 Tax=Aquimarina algiphila TaxID=2047982 RepID=UPI0024900BDB|nr:suppressor of fused domain protein [Aquimarina algiphila]
MDYQKHFDASYEKRNSFWKEIGNLESDVLSHLINPSFMGGPTWPSLRQSFIKIDTPGSTFLATDGLSDPYSDYDTNEKNQAYNGLGFELYVETENLENLDTVKNSWQFDILYQAGLLAADNGNLINLFQQYTYLSTELYNIKVPDNFVNEDGRVGVLMGLQSDRIPKQIELSIEPILLVNVKLITPDEVKYITEHGTNGRNEIVEKIMQQGNATFSSLDRKSVLL